VLVHRLVQAVSTFRDPRERGRAFGVFGSVAGGGGAVGLILGGVLTQYFCWRWTLYVNLIPAAIAAAGALIYMRTNRTGHSSADGLGGNRPRLGRAVRTRLRILAC
jgi:MFS family permease